MTEKIFKEWVRILNKKENMAYDGIFSTLFRKDNARLRIMKDNRHTLILIFIDTETSHVLHPDNTVTRHEWIIQF